MIEFLSSLGEGFPNFTIVTTTAPLSHSFIYLCKLLQNLASFETLETREQRCEQQRHRVWGCLRHSGAVCPELDSWAFLLRTDSLGTGNRLSLGQFQFQSRGQSPQRHAQLAAQVRSELSAVPCCSHFCFARVALLTSGFHSGPFCSIPSLCRDVSQQRPASSLELCLV